MNNIKTNYQKMDMLHHMHPSSNFRQIERDGPIVMVQGEGIYVYDEAGNRYLEGMAGLWCAALGFNDKRLADAAYRQLQKLPFYHTFSTMSHPSVIELADKLVEMAPVPMHKVHFTSSASEANDLIVKLIWYRSNALDMPQKKKIISRINGYHGVTIASASLTGLKRNHEKFDLPLPRMLHTACPDYRNAADGESEMQFSMRLASELEALILAEGPETIAAFFGEPVIGGGGVITPPMGYWKAVQNVLRKYDILLVADEVICGFGRTGKMFGCETYDIQPDVMTLSKQITSSYIPLSAILMNKKFIEPIADQSEKLGRLGHGYTASGHPVATAVALENIRIIEEDRLIENCCERAITMAAQLQRISSMEGIRGCRSVGLLGALDLEPWDVPGQRGEAVAAAAMKNGLILRNVGETLCFCPPLIISDPQIHEMFEVLQRAIRSVDQSVDYPAKAH